MSRLLRVLFCLAVLTTLLNLAECTGVCTTHQFECANGRCLPMSWTCDGEDDCGDQSDESQHLCHEVSTCSETEFRCASGECIPKRWQCDSENDCKDHSDENPSVCSTKNCTADFFQCKNRPGECIPVSWICDHNADCSDGSDEESCNGTCTSDEFTCANGRCINKRWHCDRENDCGDNSDEGADCPLTTCPEDSHMTCGDGSCVPLKWRCDGDPDCNDGADEMDCSSSTPNATSLCNGLEFACGDKINCIHSTWRCDGDKDCPDGSDEIDCPAVTCRADQFQCDDGICIPGHFQCSGQAECLDGSDESQCNSTVAESCNPSTHFDCGDGLCLSLDKVCDGNNDCGDWSDEPKGRCNTNECAVNNGGCSQLCIDTAWGFRCDCRPGYALVDNSTCKDVDECQQDGVCSHICVNERGSYKCECHEGYTKDPQDHTRCKANAGGASLLFAHRTDIRRLSLDHLDLSLVVNETRSATALDFHYATGMLFWSDVNDERIYKAPMNNASAPVVVIKGDVVTSDGLAVDWVYNHLYWTDSSKNTIEVADFDGDMKKILVADSLQQPRAIAVDPINGWMYWSDWGAVPRIERAGMDGSHRQVIVDSHLKWPNGLTLDLLQRKVYWADAKLNLIGSCNFDGSQRKVVVSSSSILKHPFSISVFEDYVYWSDWDKQSILRANKFTGKDASNLTAPYQLQNPMAVHVYHPYRQPRGVNHCSPAESRCSQLCLPAPQITGKSPRISCACTAGYTLAKDGFTCVRAVYRYLTTRKPSLVNVTNPPEQITNLSRTLIKDDEETTTVAPTASPDLLNKILEKINKEDSSSIASDYGTITGIIIGSVTALVVFIGLIAFFIYRQFIRGNSTTINFDNPVYRKTTVNAKESAPNNRRSGASKEVGETTEPLNAPTANEHV